MRIEVNGNQGDRLFVLTAALRYALGRRTYAASALSEVITDNLDLLNEEDFVIMLRDLRDDEAARKRRNADGQKHDGDCGGENWMRLKAALIAEYGRRGFPDPLEDFGTEIG